MHTECAERRLRIEAYGIHVEVVPDQVVKREPAVLHALVRHQHYLRKELFDRGRQEFGCFMWRIPVRLSKEDVVFLTGGELEKLHEGRECEQLRELWI